MTVVAVKKRNGKIEMSCDDQTTYGDWKMTKEPNHQNVDDVGKIYKVNRMLIGAAGNVSESNMLKLFAKNHRPKDASEESVLEFLLEFRNWIATKTGKTDYKLGNQVFIVFDGEVFECWSMMVQRRSTFWAIGSGMFLALAAMELGKNTKEAVGIAKKFDLYCGGDTKTLTI